MEYTKKILTIVNHGIGEKLAAVTREAGALGGTILVGRGSASSLLLRLLALSDVEKDVLITLVTDEQFDTVFSSIKTAPFYIGKNRGIACVMYLGGTSMERETAYELITIITNRGYAEDIMATARSAGARGGTILHARGTGNPDDEKFFGITIVPEKEQILILSERATSRAIKEAIATLPCLTNPGSGIMYTVPVEEFVQLGKRN